MRRRWLWVFMAVLAVVSVAGCADSVYNVPKERYRSVVKTLGVVPLVVDGARMQHPQTGRVLDLLRRHSAHKETALVEMLRENRAYFDVRKVDGDPVALLGRLVAGRQAVDDERGGYVYRFRPERVAELTRRSATDALLVVILSGASRVERRWDRTRLNYLDAPFESILVSAAVVLPTGEVVWEYRSPVGEPFVFLQYPDFDEAYHNSAAQVATKYLTLQGVERILTAPDAGWFGDGGVPGPYRELFDKLVSELRPGLLNPFSRPAPEQVP